MIDSFFQFFDSERVPFDPELPEWKTVSFKKYPLSPRISLPKPSKLTHELSQTLLKRKTCRSFSQTPLDLQAISDLLFWGAGLTREFTGENQSLRRTYPSGGSRYPVELYIVLRHAKDVEQGIFHYNVPEHALEKIKNARYEEIYRALPYDFAHVAPAIILLSCVGERTLQKYGSLGYKLALLEGGHIGQNISLVGTALGLGVLALGGIDYKIAQVELDFDEKETIFYQLAVGQCA